MQDAWYILSWAWTAVSILYCMLAGVASKRLRGREKKINHAILIVFAGLVGVRFWTRYAFGGQVYRLTVLFVGIAAGVAALIVAKMLISQKPREGRDEDESIGSDDRIQSLKLN
jgi:hypothetical protein